MFVTLFNTAHFYWVKLNKDALTARIISNAIVFTQFTRENIRSMVFCGQNNTVKHGVYCVLQGAA